MSDDQPKRNDARGFVMKNAPWDSNAAAPDTSSDAEFPSFPGATGSAVAPKASHAWGPGRRF